MRPLKGRGRMLALPGGPDRIHTLGMLDGWFKRGANECAALYRSPIRIELEYFHPETGLEATLYSDGTVECEGAVPVEVLHQLLAEYHLSLRGKVA